MKLYPLKLAGPCKGAIWGGERLNKLYGKGDGSSSIAESWELTVRETEVSTAASGELCGMRLDEIFRRFPKALGTEVDPEHFPILIKFIDAADDLSIQVHPSDEYARSRENDHGKSELWYVIDAAEDAKIVFGVKDGTDEAVLREHLKDGDCSPLLRRVKVSAGDAFYIPAGQIHALCRGTLVAEIQQNSDLTYRIFDYNRLGLDGRPRELHVKKALEVSKAYSERDIQKMRFCGREGRRKAPNGARVLADCEFFRVCELNVSGGESAEIFVGDEAFAALVFVSSDGASLSSELSHDSVAAGDTFFVPAGMGRVRLDGDCTVLIAEV